MHLLSALQLELFFFMKGPIYFQYEVPDLQTFFPLSMLMKEYQRRDRRHSVVNKADKSDVSHGL